MYGIEVMVWKPRKFSAKVCFGGSAVNRPVAGAPKFYWENLPSEIMTWWPERNSGLMKVEFTWPQQSEGTGLCMIPQVVVGA